MEKPRLLVTAPAQTMRMNGPRGPPLTYTWEAAPGGRG